MTFSARPAEFAVPEITGDAQEFLATLGEPAALPTLADAAQALALDSIRDAASLEKFLHGYREQILRPLELPAILAAHQHAARNELRERSRALSSDPTATHLADAIPDDATVCTIGWSGHVVDALVRRAPALQATVVARRSRGEVA